MHFLFLFSFLGVASFLLLNHFSTHSSTPSPPEIQQNCSRSGHQWPPRGQIQWALRYLSHLVSKKHLTLDLPVLNTVSSACGQPTPPGCPSISLSLLLSWILCFLQVLKASSSSDLVRDLFFIANPLSWGDLMLPMAFNTIDVCLPHTHEWASESHIQISTSISFCRSHG